MVTPGVKTLTFALMAEVDGEYYPSADGRGK